MTVNDISAIEHEFFRYFPRSQAQRPFNYRQAIAAKRHIENHVKINGAKKAFTDLELAEFEELVLKRQVKSFFDLNTNIQDSIRSFILAYETYYNVKIQRLYLTGSFVEGHWRTESTLNNAKNDRLLELIYKIKGKRGVSDIDVFPEPLMGNIQVGKVQVHTQPWEQTCIYKNDEFI